MTKPSGYVMEPLREGPEFTLDRGWQRGDKMPVLAVALATELPSPQSLRPLEYEYLLSVCIRCIVLVPDAGTGRNGSA